ncbi:hypothetical protein GCM10011318_13760 [Phaeocystidibacter marisrubri]|nr:hypothetical protein GCM10011318_13760 [Phaeocystidibacter marisrubri]
MSQADDFCAVAGRNDEAFEIGLFSEFGQQGGLLYLTQAVGLTLVNVGCPVTYTEHGHFLKMVCGPFQTKFFLNGDKNTYESNWKIPLEVK